MKLNKIHIYILYILFLALGICQLIRVEPNIDWEADTFIGVCVAMMAITMAIIIGYQAISAYEIKNDLKEQQRENGKLRKEIENLKRNSTNNQLRFENRIQKEIHELQSKINSLKSHSDRILSSSQESVAILNALILENSHNNKDITALDAFEKMHEALLYGLDYESKNIDFIFYKLRQYVSNITSLTFGGSFCYTKGIAYFCSTEFSGQSLRSVLDDKLLLPIKSTEKKIRKHKIFSSISHDYSILMEQLNKRLDIISSRHFPKDASESDVEL